MKDFVREENCTFYVNEAARKIVCVYYLEAFSTEYWYFTPFTIPDEIVKIPQKFVGIATCSPQDKWDEKLGRRIAFLKTRKKYYNSFFKAANRAINYCDNELARITDEFNAFGTKIDRSIINEEKRLQGLINE